MRARAALPFCDLGGHPPSHAHPLTGVAGTGKSTLLREIKRYLVETARKHVVTVAPTGIAAINVGGTTFHSYTGIGVPKTREDFGKMWAKVRTSCLIAVRARALRPAPSNF